MSERIFRALLQTTTVPAATREPDTTRYEKGLTSSYTRRAGDALARAEALSYANAGTRTRDALWVELAASAESLCKAVRVAHGLSATRSRNLRELIEGGPDDGIPTSSEWATLLRPLTSLPEPSASGSEDPIAWIAFVRDLLDRAALLAPRRKRVSARAFPRARANGAK